jgi:hypothetical protein
MPGPSTSPAPESGIRALLEAPDWVLRRAVALYALLDERQRDVVCDFACGFYRRKTVYAHPEVPCDADLLAAVAGQAALVGAAQRTGYFASVRWIYFCTDDLADDGDARGGSTVRLQADICRQESARLIPGQNLVVHEFAHILDHQFGISGSTPALRSAHRRYLEQLEREDQGDGGVMPPEWDWESGGLDGLADTYPQEEFFAYLSEDFFTRPTELALDEPALYADLVAIYGLDMAQLFRRGALS